MPHRALQKLVTLEKRWLPAGPCVGARGFALQRTQRLFWLAGLHFQLLRHGGSGWLAGAAVRLVGHLLTLCKHSSFKGQLLHFAALCAQ